MTTRQLTLLIAAILLAFGIYVYNYPPGSISDDILDGSICSNYAEEPMSELKVALVHKMASGYRLRQGDAINTKFNTRDAEAIWFDLETLKKFIYHLEVETKEVQDTISSKHLGLRIYYASYPDSRSWGNYPELADLNGEGYQGLHTLFMIPTIRIDNDEVDFNPLDPDTYSGGLGVIPAYENQEISNPQETFVLAGKIEDKPDDEVGAQNHGGLHPPRLKRWMGF